MRLKILKNFKMYIHDEEEYDNNSMKKMRWRRRRRIWQQHDDEELRDEQDMILEEGKCLVLKMVLNVKNVFKRWECLVFLKNWNLHMKKIICLLFRLIFMQELINQTELQNRKKSSNRKIEMIFMEILCKSANEPLSDHNNCKKTD